MDRNGCGRRKIIPGQLLLLLLILSKDLTACPVANCTCIHALLCHEVFRAHPLIYVISTAITIGSFEIGDMLGAHSSGSCS